MYAEQVIELLKQYAGTKEHPGKQVLLKYCDEWLEVCGVNPTRHHRNAITLEVRNPNLGGGVIIVAPDLE